MRCVDLKKENELKKEKRGYIIGAWSQANRPEKGNRGNWYVHYH